MSDKLFVTAIEPRGTGAHPQAWRRQDSRAEEVFTAAFWIEQLRAADRAGIDLVFLADSFASRTLEAVAVAARAAALTERIGLIPTVTVTHTERRSGCALFSASRAAGGCPPDSCRHRSRYF